jgi:hypothetical protein
MRFYKPMLAKSVSKPFSGTVGFLRLSGMVLER